MTLADSVREEIILILKQDGAQFPNQIARKIGQSSIIVTRLLHEMVDDGRVSFKWTKGYSL